MIDKPIWGTRREDGRCSFSVFPVFQKKVVAVGWTAVGDLSAIPQNREVFKAAVAKTYPMHYEQFDSRHKGVLPLKRVYVPDPDESGEE